MKENNRKAANIIFIAFFMLALIIPVCFMNFKESQVSDIDNKLLTEWPDMSAGKIDSETISDIESYVNDRIGFRSDAIKLYTTACDKLFKVLVHPLYMYGRDGHIYYREDEYITAYQRLNTDEEFIDTFIDFLKKTNDYCTEKNIKFLYYLCTDKKTIYPEYFPASINVKQDNESVLECMQRKLENTDIEYIIPYDTLMEQKKTDIIYNKKSDVAHWNELGSFTAHGLLDDKVQGWFSDVEPLSIDAFNVEYVNENKLYQSELKIDEDVPVYSLKNDTSEDATDYLSAYLDMTTTDFYKHYMNPNVNNNHVLLVFTDSYFVTYAKYYNNRFREVYYIHRQNFQNLQYYVNLLFPDIIIFETAERCITSDMTLTDMYGSFDDFYYERPYSAHGEIHNPADGDYIPDLSYTITGSSGIRVDGDKLIINPDGGDNIVSVTGRMNNYEAAKDLDIYLVIDGNVLETDYNAIHKDNPFTKVFSFNVQRRYIGQSQISLIAVDNKTGAQYDIETFEVIYGR